MGKSGRFYLRKSSCNRVALPSPINHPKSVDVRSFAELCQDNGFFLSRYRGFFNVSTLAAHGTSVVVFFFPFEGLNTESTTLILKGGGRRLQPEPGLEPSTWRSRVWRLNHSATPLPTKNTSTLASTDWPPNRVSPNFDVTQRAVENAGMNPANAHGE